MCLDLFSTQHFKTKKKISLVVRVAARNHYISHTAFEISLLQGTNRCHQSFCRIFRIKSYNLFQMQDTYLCKVYEVFDFTSQENILNPET